MLGPMCRRPLLPAIPIYSHCRAHQNNSKPKTTKTPKATKTETESGTVEGRGGVSGNDIIELVVVRIVALS
jgi:hypothetical protein